MDFDKTKFKRLVHYVALKAGKRDWFGATKLNKVLWYADARTYVLHGHSITGETYVRQQHGPVPKHIIPIRTEMEREGTIKCFKDGSLTRVVALTPADPMWFSQEELRSINHWIDHIDQYHTAQSISEKTHDYVWEIAKMGEELPLYAYRVLRIPEELREEDLTRLKSRARELGLV